MSTAGLDILLVEDDAGMKTVFEACLVQDGHQVTLVETPAEARQALMSTPYDLAFVDLRLGAESGLDLIPEIRDISPWTSVIIVTGHGTVESAVDAMKRGASDYLLKPFSPIEVRAIAARQEAVLRLQRRVASLEADVDRSIPPSVLESANPTMRRALATARQVADTDASVLLTGESGTGKGIVARAIHDWSARSDRPFSVINCPSLTPELLRSELFGHVRGAFTGAVSNYIGKISATDGGTLFLDEIGDLESSIQPQLLRFIQDREFERLGDTRTRRADVRILAATNRPLRRMVARGEFREDLWYRLRVIEIELPPLRSRPQDIPGLAATFLEFFARKYGKRIAGFSDATQDFLISYDWPGNARELRNAVERAVILGREELVDLGQRAGPDPAAMSALPADLLLDNEIIPLDEVEKRYILYALGRSRTVEEAAESLGVAPSTLWRRRRKHGI